MTRLTVHVHPRARRNAVAVREDATLEVWTMAPPVDGRANEAVCELIADHLGVCHRDVWVATGASGRTKVLEVSTLTEKELRDRLRK